MKPFSVVLSKQWFVKQTNSYFTEGGFADFLETNSISSGVVLSEWIEVRCIGGNDLGKGGGTFFWGVVFFLSVFFWCIGPFFLDGLHDRQQFQQRDIKPQIIKMHTRHMIM